MTQSTKTKYTHPKVLVDTQRVDEYLKDKNARIAVKTAINKNYYDKNNFRFVLCESCYWIAFILKDVFKISQCPRCKKKKIYIERISR